MSNTEKPTATEIISNVTNFGINANAQLENKMAVQLANEALATQLGHNGHERLGKALKEDSLPKNKL